MCLFCPSLHCSPRRCFTPAPSSSRASLPPSIYLVFHGEGEKRHKLDQTASYQICHRAEKFPRVTLPQLSNEWHGNSATAMRAKLTYYYSAVGKRGECCVVCYVANDASDILVAMPLKAWLNTFDNSMGKGSLKSANRNDPEMVHKSSTPSRRQLCVISNHILSSFINQAWGDVFPLINGNRLKSNLSSTSLSSQLTNHDPKSLLLFYMII